jgi:hypothetical protein
MADLDYTKFRTEGLLIKTLDQTVDNIHHEIDVMPMILFTGGGYHVYQPVDMPERVNIQTY